MPLSTIVCNQIRGVSANINKRQDERNGGDYEREKSLSEAFDRVKIREEVSSLHVWGIS
ncbi:hypothetical protein SERLA73DRAFT_192211 [Serpula lacrymans var. lacrymans S7.3]|uniref:Uncharacterized protein n=2 Tax=Serpula lacrymans var. lacrymans TaxID=341189 RepID=F8QJB3_SERL3|nr:uncharacterized protein SERLADRAFT_471443 [Serpula lacrymans var. lacrymans S7.9]XP_007320167.1 uncharacterized protein SERLADRAFT_471457 [Serpula lacrymans var. lacrymans S7.9]EGN91608.1 hypothetical protein SERLA73DRAFT_192211 [Serpula lacrymans var. lacrymans S7.3]EGO22909.1 hypothetical protein SERLADRAFT_471443 [Serpula lacrymans var. lacrymans S7.9]EGO22927.1 hypothetical protein SERLADRAFT_471457 [Serpula lacrymans var. lacrymans S7.9]